MPVLALPLPSRRLSTILWHRWVPVVLVGAVGYLLASQIAAIVAVLIAAGCLSRSRMLGRMATRTGRTQVTAGRVRRSFFEMRIHVAGDAPSVDQAVNAARSSGHVGPLRDLSFALFGAGELSEAERSSAFVHELTGSIVYLHAAAVAAAAQGNVPAAYRWLQMPASQDPDPRLMRCAGRPPRSIRRMLNHLLSVEVL